MGKFGTILMGALCALAAGAALADRALVIGASEPARRGLLRGTSDIDSAQALRDAGFEVITADATSVVEMRAALSRFLDGIETEERVVVHLSGGFLHGGGRSWLIEAAASTVPDLATVDDIGLSVDSVLAIAGRVPGGAVVALGQGRSPVTPGTGLEPGLAPGPIPQGVSLAEGPADAVARFVAGPLLAPGQSVAGAIATDNALVGHGFLAPQVPFLPMDAERPAAPPNAAEVERAIWQATVAQDSVRGYEGYLDRYPEGFFVEEAREAIERIRTEPNRQARLAEEALALTRDDRRKIQRELTLLGHEPRGVDGVFGPGSRAAISRFQVQNGFPDTGFVDATQIARLALQAERHRAEQAAADRRQQIERDRLDREAWAALGQGRDEAQLRTYLERYPEGLHAPIARERLATIEAEAAAKLAALDRADWTAASEAGTKSAYEAYLAAHPDGAHAGEARARLEAAERVSGDAQDAAQAGEAALGMSALSRMLVEQRLERLRMEPGKVDGTFDADTRAALRRFQRSRGLEETGYMNRDVAAQMLSDLGEMILPGR